MFDYFLDYLSKPFLGLAILVRLFSGGDADSTDPSVASLKFVYAKDSVFVQALIRNGLTPEIKDLMDGGVVIKTACTFTCGAFSKHWERALQYNPVKRSGCYLSLNGNCDGIFKEESLSRHFSRIEFYLADFESVKKIQSMPAKLKISTSINVEAMAIGEKKVWPTEIIADFKVPELPIVK
jgi:hypothetical protein